MKEDDPTKPLPPGMELMQEILDRIKALEAKVDERLKDTRPIWERALSEILEAKSEILGVKSEVLEVKSEILEVKEAVKRFDRKLDILNRGLFDLRAEHEELAARVPPPEPTQ